MFRASIFEVVGGFDENIGRGEDTEFTRRFRHAGFTLHFAASTRVRHDYSRFPADTLRKCFLTGCWRERLFTSSTARNDSALRFLARKFFGARKALLRARYAENPFQYVIYLPWLLVFELATITGHAAARFGLPLDPAGGRNRADVKHGVNRVQQPEK